MRVLSLFSGIGAFEKALERLGIEHEVVNYCEIDKYASKAYSLIHNVPEEKNLVDVTKVDTSKLKDLDLITYGFPCQDLSTAGRLRVFEFEGERTRSGLFYEALRIIKDTQPKWAIAENVKNLTSKKFTKEFESVLSSLESVGYNNYWKVLNAKDFGIPQSRTRVFIVSIRKDIDDGKFRFPNEEPLNKRLRDILEDNVDPKYYITGKSLDYILANGTKNFKCTPEIDLEIARCLTASMHKVHRASQDNFVSELFCKHDIKVDIENGKPVLNKNLDPIKLGNLYSSGGQNGNVYSTEGVSPTIVSGTTDTKGNGGIGSCNAPKIIDVQYSIDKETGVYTLEPFIVASRGRNPNNPSDRTVGAPTEQRFEANNQGICNTLTTVQKDNYVCEPKIEVVGNYSPSAHDASRIVSTEGLAPTVKENHGTVTAIVEDPKKLFNLYEKKGQAGNVYDENSCAPCIPGFGGGGGGKELKILHDLKIRKLTPKECFRLMGFEDKDIDVLVENGISNTQLYKMAGNSIVVDVLVRLFECLVLKKNQKKNTFIFGI